ncbi:alpha/beta hydrolase [Polynucleobacter sp. AP-Elch-400A-B2]|uniref:alpha/beta fold hydrolase n=1 Tax=Polynucleobacter sp. AP-Elch-400A-B2 TaxID=2576930 RepID=UPI001BFD1DD4|nr:alpha/beta hydrolase [Polynucleobacter sp. AP-Elch-400A-B2]QWE25172.1 alpha/beta hydrolase [Polynucleobacter sp. AP-Elch-400A-B2]
MSPHLIQSTLEKCLNIPEVMADARYSEFQCVLEVVDAKGDIQQFDVLPSQTQLPLISLRASEATWEKIWSSNPPVGYQSIGALRRQVPDFTITGKDIQIAQSLPFLERLLEAFRNTLHPIESNHINWDGLENISGSYLKIGPKKDYWIYQEQTGTTDKPAILMLHTAGADSRQWHGLMCNKQLQAEWKMHAFDIPGHGRSPLPPGVANWNWRLTEADYLCWIIDYMDAANISKAIVMGCSMGSAIGLALIAKYPDRFIGGVLLEMPYRSPGRRSPYLNHPQVHGSRLAAAWVGSLLSPSSPKSRKDFATWIYSQGAPSIYDGDLAFYSDDFDARNHTGSVNTQKTPLWLLTGDYDYSATPADTLKVANEIPGANFTELKGFGHFPMVENPEGLIPYLLSPLNALKKLTTNQ